MRNPYLQTSLNRQTISHLHCNKGNNLIDQDYGKDYRKKCFHHRRDGSIIGKTGYRNVRGVERRADRESRHPHPTSGQLQQTAERA